MKPIFGITVARRRARQGKEGKSIWGVMTWKRRLQGLMILLPSSIGVLQHTLTFQ
uniref:Uncharacterized protein n=1 Tax=Rhizophora mucronata TaxID=61149 RepID=A0A2P2Q810_RHIMU